MVSRNSFASSLLVSAFALLPIASLVGATPVPPRTVEVSDTYFGKNYPDPFRWLEDLKNPDTVAWFKSQAAATDEVLASLPGREALVKEWLALDKLRPAKYGGIVFKNGKVFYKKFLAADNVGKLYVRDGWRGQETLLFDPLAYKPGTTTTIEAALPSPDGKRVVLALSAGGAEYSEIRVLDVAKKELLAESFYPTMGIHEWLPDGSGFLYDAGKVSDIKSQEVELHRKVRIHYVGTKFDNDADVLSDESCPALAIEAREIPQAFIEDAAPGFVIGSLGTVQNEMRLLLASVADLKAGKLTWKSLCEPSDNLVRGFTIHGDFAYAITHEGAPHYKLVRTPLAKPDWKHAETVLAETNETLEGISSSRDFLLIEYSNGIRNRLFKYTFATAKTTEVSLPLAGKIGVSCPDWHSNRFLVGITGWTLPTTRYNYDPANDSFSKSEFNTAVEYPGFENLVSEEVEVPSHDGVMVPLSIIRRKDMPFDGSTPCMLEGYGAYGMSFPAYFDIQNSVAIHGVVVAIAHPRGGSEKGEAWYRGGYKTTKPNTWKDFIACGEYLVKKGYTSPAKLAGTGTSAGGILITRAITERPDLFAAAVCNVGCANALRLEFSANGPVNIPEFGTVANETECLALAEMDGVSHVLPGGKYPAVLGVGGWNDPRVPVWQPGKFVAAMQLRNASGKPALMKVNYDNGHFTEDKSVTFNNFAGQFAFMLWQTGHKEFQPLAKTDAK